MKSWKLRKLTSLRKDFSTFLPVANECCGKVMFSVVSFHRTGVPFDHHPQCHWSDINHMGDL